MKFAASLSILISGLLLPPTAFAGSLRAHSDEQTDETHRQLWDNPLRDVVFMVDGSNTINSYDWYIERSGIAAAIENPAVVPRDGSVAVTVIQYASNEVIEVPYTLVQSQHDVDDIVRVINQMVPMGGGFSYPGDAVQTAHEHILYNARHKARQVFCMTTDSTGYEGSVPLAEALKTAKRSNYKLDTFSVVAIGNSGTPDGNFHTFFDPMLIDGKLEIAKSSNDFIESVQVACFDYNKNSEVNSEIRSPEPNQEFMNYDTIPLHATVDQPYDEILWFVDDDFATTGKRAEIFAGDYEPNKFHSVAFYATRNAATISSARVSIYIKGSFNNPPQVEINAPFIMRTFQTGEVIEFNAYADDKEDGVLNGSNVRWHSNKDGFLGHGSIVYKNANQLDIGRHIISVVAEDSAGATDSKSTIIKVTQAPLVSVVQPLQDAAFYGETVHLLATATTATGATIPDGDVVWTSNLNGEIGRGQAASVSSGLLAYGKHEITCTAKDGNGRRGADSVFIVVVAH